MADLDLSELTAQWLTTGFMLTMAVVIPLTGFLMGRFSTRQVFSIAMTLFTIGTVVCVLAPGFLPLLAGRIVQACGTAIMMPLDRKSTRLNSSHVATSYAVFCLDKKTSEPSFNNAHKTFIPSPK